jgi:hypothetical protein
MGDLNWAGALAASLIAIGTVARWGWIRLRRTARWTAAMIELPDTVAELSSNVRTLTASVDTLARAVDGRAPLSLERLCYTTPRAPPPTNGYTPPSTPASGSAP